MRSIEEYMNAHSGCGQRDTVFFIGSYLFYINNDFDTMSIEHFQDGLRTDFLHSSISVFFGDDVVGLKHFDSLPDREKFDFLLNRIPWQLNECSWAEITPLDGFYRMKVQEQFDWSYIKSKIMADGFDRLPEMISGMLIPLGTLNDLYPSKRSYISFVEGLTDWEVLHDITWKSVMEDEVKSFGGILATPGGDDLSLYIFLEPKTRL